MTQFREPVSLKEVQVKYIDAKHPSQTPHLRSGFCGECFKERVFLLNTDYNRALCRYCGTVYLVKVDHA